MADANEVLAFLPRMHRHEYGHKSVNKNHSGCLETLSVTYIISTSKFS